MPNKFSNKKDSIQKDDISKKKNEKIIYQVLRIDSVAMHDIYFNSLHLYLNFQLQYRNRVLPSQIKYMIKIMY